MPELASVKKDRKSCFKGVTCRPVTIVCFISQEEKKNNRLFVGGLGRADRSSNTRADCVQKPRTVQDCKVYCKKIGEPGGRATTESLNELPPVPW